MKNENVTAVNRIKLNLQFFASADSEGRTEKPTSKRKTEARKEGQVAKSQEITVAFSLLFVFWTIKLFGEMMSTGLEELFYYSLLLVTEYESQFSVMRVTGLIIYLVGRIGIIVAPIFAAAFIVAFITNIIQVGWHPTTKPLKFDLKKLNPVSGFKKLFSLKSLYELPKALVKLGLISFIIYLDLRKETTTIFLVLDMELEQGLIYIADICIRLGIKVGAWYMLIAAVDYLYTRHTHTESLKMTKQQVKDEWKNQEGDPQIKAKIRQKMREVSMRRMMQEVPHADVIITNPTHYAVALKYDRAVSAAPIMVAKGVDFLAEKIKKVGKENGVHIVENRHLARTLYSAVDVGQEIPEELYQSVAEILAYVYSIKNSA